MKITWISKLFIYFVIITIAGPYFDNWISTEKLLFLGDAYVGKCKESEIDGPPSNTFRCEEQQLAISGLLSYARMLEFISSVAIGISVDRFGPRVVSLVGVLLCILSWVFLGFFPKSGVMLKISMVCIGISTNATLFPAITIESYTKKYKPQTMIFICSSSSFTCFLIKFIEIIVRRSNLTPRMVTFYFTLFFLIPCFIASFIFFPNDLKSDVKKIGESYDEEEFIADSSHLSQLSKQASFISRQHSFETNKSKGELSVFEEIRKSISNVETVNLLHKRSPETQSLVKGTPPTKKNSFDKELGEVSFSEDVKVTNPSKWTWKGFLESIWSIEVVLCTFYYSLNVISLTYSQQTFTIMYSDNKFLLEFAEYVLPFSFVPCIFFMIYTRFFSPYVLLATVGVLWSGLHICSVFVNYPSGILTALLFTISYSIYNTHVYVYLESNVNKDYYSSILGFLNTVGGISVLINIFLIRPISNTNLIINIHYTLFSIRIAFLLMFTYLYFRRLVKYKKIHSTHVELG